MSVLLFAGDDYYPSGGWSDFVGEFPSVVAARKRVSETRVKTVRAGYMETFDSSLCSSTGLTGARDRTFKVGDRFNTGRVTAVRDKTITVKFPKTTDVSYEFDWAHIVKGGEIVASFDGKWRA